MVDINSGPTETKAEREARERAEAQADARNTKALQTDLRSQTRELIRRFGLQGALAGAGSPVSGGGFGSVIGGGGGGAGGGGGTAPTGGGGTNSGIAVVAR